MTEITIYIYYWVITTVTFSSPFMFYISSRILEPRTVAAEILLMPLEKLARTGMSNRGKPRTLIWPTSSKGKITLMWTGRTYIKVLLNPLLRCLLLQIWIMHDSVQWAAQHWMISMLSPSPPCTRHIMKLMFNYDAKYSCMGKKLINKPTWHQTNKKIHAYGSCQQLLTSGQLPNTVTVSRLPNHS